MHQKATKLLLPSLPIMQKDYGIHLGFELEVVGMTKHSVLFLAIMVGVHVVH
jgi:hypothetical protein